MSIQSQVQVMIDDLTGILEDAGKADEGKKVAGTRVRKVMQAIKAAAQETRISVLEAQKNPE